MLISKTVTQKIRNGKFRFEKKVKGNERYSLLLYPCVEALDLYVSPGTKANITGNDAHPSVWNVKSDNQLQKEWNAIQKLERDSVPEYLSTQLRLTILKLNYMEIRQEARKKIS